MQVLKAVIDFFTVLILRCHRSKESEQTSMSTVKELQNIMTKVTKRLVLPILTQFRPKSRLQEPHSRHTELTLAKHTSVVQEDSESVNEMRTSWTLSDSFMSHRSNDSGHGFSDSHLERCVGDDLEANETQMDHKHLSLKLSLLKFMTAVVSKVL